MFFEKHRNVIVAGASRLGTMIAGMLCDQGFNVTVVDIDSDSFRKLPENFSGFEVVADATDIDALGRIGAKNATMLVATTESDDKNSLIAQIGRTIFGIPRIFLRIDDPDKESTLSSMNVGVLSPTRLSISEFGRLSDIGMTVEH